MRPSLEEVLVVRRERQAMVRDLLASLDDARLRTVVISTGAPGWPMVESCTIGEALETVLREEWEHRLYAERDLAVLAR